MRSGANGRKQEGGGVSVRCNLCPAWRFFNPRGFTRSSRVCVYFFCIIFARSDEQKHTHRMSKTNCRHHMHTKKRRSIALMLQAIASTWSSFACLYEVSGFANIKLFIKHNLFGALLFYAQYRCTIPMHNTDDQFFILCIYIWIFSIGWNLPSCENVWWYHNSQARTSIFGCRRYKTINGYHSS